MRNFDKKDHNLGLNHSPTSTKRIRGVVMNVVTSTIIENEPARLTPMSRPMLRMMSSITPDSLAK
jgi:hypothetical protein